MDFSLTRQNTLTTKEYQTEIHEINDNLKLGGLNRLGRDDDWHSLQSFHQMYNGFNTHRLV